ncbi:hypothetical protein ACMFMG_010491 [Clarireedia jacksonii]
MGNFEESINALYRTYHYVKLTNKLNCAVEAQPDVVMRYPERMANIDFHDVKALDIFKRVLAALKYKGDRTAYLENMLLYTGSGSSIPKLATDCLLGQLDLVDAKSAINFWTRLILKYLEDKGFRY